MEWDHCGMHYQYTRSPLPNDDVQRHNKPETTNNVYSNTPAFGGGQSCAQFLLPWIRHMSPSRECRWTICLVTHGWEPYQGAIDRLISDHAQAEISSKVIDVLWHFCIDDWQRLIFQHQNFAKCRFHDVKKKVNAILNPLGALPQVWLHCMCDYVSCLAARSCQYNVRM